MKNFYLTLAAIVWCTATFAQNTQVDTKINNFKTTTANVLKEAEHLKTGNYLDVLTSFFQMTTQNLTGDDKNIAFNGTLFAIKAEADPSLLIDHNFANETFARNFQFNFKFDLDNNYKYSGFTGGFTYAIINDRDRKLANFMKDRKKYSDLITSYQELSTNITNATNAYIASYTATPGVTPAQIASEMAQIQEGLDTLHKYHKTTKFPAAFLQQLSTKLDVEMATVDSLRVKAYAEIDKGSLLTFSAAGSADDKGKLNKGTMGLIFLKGNLFGKRASGELDIRSKFTYADTLVTKTLQRTALNNTLGFNFVLLKSKALNKSLFELKVYGEYDRIFKNVLPGEKKDTFLANSDLRIRITDKLWLPLTIKYDVTNSNFLGFLNISYNFQSVSGKSSSQ